MTRRNTLLASAAVAALLLAWIVPQFRRTALSLSHPDPVGPTVYSKSAIGHLAFENLLADLGVPTSISESGSGGYAGPNDILVVAEPRTDDATIEDVRAMLTARTVLLVLPKRSGTPGKDRPYWLGDDKLLSDADINRVLSLADKQATLVRNASLASVAGVLAAAGLPSIEKPQLIRSKLLHPLLASPDGILIGERRTSTGRLIVLSDPDLIANYALARGDNSVIAVALVERLLGKDSTGTVIFDEFIHGFSPKPFHLLGILFQFPFVLVTMQLAVAIVLLVWTATARFGVPLPLAPPLEAGKRSLIDTGARLLTQSGRTAELSGRYFEEIVRDTARRLRAPRGLDLAALLSWIGQIPGAPPAPAGDAPPQTVWKWRNALLGESRPDPKLD